MCLREVSKLYNLYFVKSQRWHLVDHKQCLHVCIFICGKQIVPLSFTYLTLFRKLSKEKKNENWLFFCNNFVDWKVWRQLSHKNRYVNHNRLMYYYPLFPYNSYIYKQFLRKVCRNIYQNVKGNLSNYIFWDHEEGTIY